MKDPPAAKSFQDLLAWQTAHGLVLAIYTLTAAFPKPETYGLSLQIRRSAVSVGDVRGGRLVVLVGHSGEVRPFGDILRNIELSASLLDWYSASVGLGAWPPIGTHPSGPARVDTVIIEGADHLYAG